jgi:hypothetical protein
MHFEIRRDDMPNYSNAFPPFAIYPGDSVAVFNNENPAPPQASQQVAIGNVYGVDDAGVSVLLSYPGGAPTSVTINVQMADSDTDSAYSTVATSSNTTGDSLNLNVQRHKFVRIQKAVQTGGGAMTAVIAR